MSNDDINLDPANFNLQDPKDVERFLMTGQVALLESFNKIETDLPTVTGFFSQIDVARGDADRLVKLDQLLHRYIEALICLQVYYQQLLRIRDIETPNNWPQYTAQLYMFHVEQCWSIKFIQVSNYFLYIII